MINKSWEMSLVNEMLLQLENYDGIFIASTNYIQNLDKAIIRRFDIKMKFKALKEEKLLQTFKFFAEKLELEKISDEIKHKLLKLDNICLGDFTLILRQNKIFKVKNLDDFLNRFKK